MVDIGGGIAEAAVPRGTAVMKTAHMVAVVMEDNMMTGIGIMKNEEEGLGAEVRGIRGVVAEALEGEGTGAQLERVVLKGEPKLSNGTGKENRQNLLTRIITLITGLLNMMDHTMTSLSRMEEDIKRCK